ncbi:hypothetical protein [Enterococcus gallinarum]|uniref:hypothetical protein n=1 Tax=Enterococcus gallinarum TaxID=1353 RepID=UPI003FA53728
MRNAVKSTPFSMTNRSEMSGYFITQMKGEFTVMKKILKRLCMGVLTLATVFTALPMTGVHASETQYYADSQEKAGMIEKVMNDGSIGSTFEEGILQVNGEDVYCIDSNKEVIVGCKNRFDANTRMNPDQIADVALFGIRETVCVKP